MKINIIAVGSLNKDYLNLYNEYKKKINFYSQLNLIEIKEIVDDNIELKRKKETKLILEKMPKNSKVYYLSLKGRKLDSIQFSTLLEEDNITFIIGGSNGVCEEEFENKISFSDLTFPHQLFRVMLVEQIFRGFSIKNNGKYHK
ncbi:50S rRNA methyltransferase [Metamycoplasma hyosynoviae]|uniref:23S rRNA (pseudouridine(1915)-N(3))-methyltransferase RlmH n=1 Tax=Metamycoplasma hyosynoviae TaxID=29559 RepID=UPI000461ABB3|nr:23S rRNA (pseudouridine(1915)-N(3))-methyltransferase RlmH [Metamycoplasma hyosynoviae]KDE42164.1 50S rRNA methyltransferase [Metamycoplasma hyosynoviae]KDE42229.1 50S rRNA methyltransferase [Metamycoplasma hyosynoviae]KDE43968.1 50S rRNA methyltransferase [Metamycoplasma hyosynoviae]KDE44047.1 50S rRNA methyltransferase [Metamycoplasma hyosynoviae]MDC8920112.1 23S rRNA (pseudouridine(1915)-N(3))-methyltransferase RlmH [Metamycoplasma hyosynoviae]